MPTRPAPPPPAATGADDPTPARPLLGLALMLGSMVILPVMDGFAKDLSSRLPVAQVVWARYLFHLVAIIGVVLWRFGPRSLWPRRVGVQLLRGGLLLAATTLFFAAISRMELATTLALFFVSPLVVTLLGPAVLGESVGWRRWTAVLVGFAGVLVILRPGGGLLQGAALLALGAGVVHGMYLLATRKLAGSAPPLVTLAYTALVGAAVMSLVVGFAWVAPAPGDFARMVLMGVLAALGHYLLIKAFDHAPATWLAPLGYSEIVTSTAVGYVAFGEFPDGWTWIGIAIIVGSGVIITLREGRSRALRPGG